MSAYRHFADRLLVQLYKENATSAGNYVRFDGAARTAALSPRRDWILRFVEEVEANGFAQVSKHIGNPADWHIRIRAAGAEYVEDVLGESEVNSSSSEPTVDSSKWTGLPPSFVLTEEKRANLVRSLDVAEEGLKHLPLGQEAKAQARAYIVAARSMAEAPEPQPDLIWEILRRANSIAGIASLFVSILAVFA